MRAPAALVFVAVLGCLPVKPANAAQWTQIVPTTSPPARMFAGMAYDEARGRLVLFGGTPHFDRNTFFNDTWEWDGTDWSQVLTTTSPPGRHAMYMAYDSDRSVVVVYGGHHGFGTGSSWGDMWEYDGTDWAQVFPTVTPGPRGEGAMAFDQDRHVMVLYGGHVGGGGDLNDTWEYDGTTWLRITTPTTPSLANNEAMVYDQAGHRIVMHGGCGNGDRAWFYDGVTWSAGGSGPAGRNVHSMAYLPPTGRTVVFGGSVDCTYEQRQDTWEWNGSSWTAILPVISPSARWGMPIVYAPGNGGLVGFGGGSSGPATAETWLYTPSCPASCDADGDGYTWPADCNDTNPNTHPGAIEVCDGFDNDCDRQMDNAPECDGTCDLVQVQPITRITTSSAHSQRPALVWTGSEYGIAWYDMRDGNHEIYFVRLDGSGMRLGNDVRVTNNPDESRSPSLVWNGSGFGVAWEDDRDRDDFLMPSNEIYFGRLDSLGQMIGSEVRVTNALEWSITPSLAWNGMAYGLAWGDARNTDWEIYFAGLDAAGSKVGTDIRVTSVSGEAELPSIAWTGSRYGLAWNDARNGSREIYFATLSDTGVKTDEERRITNHFPYSSRNASLSWSGSHFGLAWMDPRAGELDIWYTILDAAGIEHVVQQPLTTTPSSADKPSLAWTGQEYGVAWADHLAGSGEVYFARIGADGMVSGAPIRITNDPAESDEPSLVWTGTEYGLAWQDARDGYSQIYFARVSCNCVDADLDGFSVCAECNDLDPTVNPNTTERCNSIDDNCNGLIDDDPAGLDSDSDGIPNACDNCRFAYNPTQADTDRDAVGNACDNCVFIHNLNQADLDADQRGDVCDNCPAQYNPFQDDFDGDRIGDVCDNCGFDRNADQDDLDNDFEGNVCDLDDGLIWISMPDAFTVAWQQESGFELFNEYRGDLSVLKSSGLYTQDPAAVALAERNCYLTDVAVNDGPDPGPGHVLFYLVAGVHLGVESSLGTNSAGAERPNANPCP